MRDVFKLLLNLSECFYQNFIPYLIMKTIVHVIVTIMKNKIGHRATSTNLIKNMLLSFKNPIFTKQSTEKA